MQALPAKAALNDRKRDKRTLPLRELLAGEAGRCARLRMHASGGNGEPAALALAKCPSRQSLQGGIDCRRFSGIAPSQQRAPLAQDGGPTVDFFR